MEIKEIQLLIDAVSTAEIKEFHLQKGDFSLDMSKTTEESPVAVVCEKGAEKEAVQVATKASTKEFVDITSPIVGIYYSAPSPDKEDYIKVGDIVKKGQIVCIIEAMKLMNEIESEYDGRVVEVLVENEQMVEYKQPLFRIEPV